MSDDKILDEMAVDDYGSMFDTPITIMLSALARKILELQEDIAHQKYGMLA